MQTLDISYNLIVDIESDAFRPLGNLYDLILNFNKLDSNYFELLTSSKDSNNRKEIRFVYIFKDLYYLTRLMLDYNRLKILKNGIFEDLESY